MGKKFITGEVRAEYDALEYELNRLTVIVKGRVDPIALEHYRLLVAALGDALEKLQKLEGEEK